MHTVSLAEGGRAPYPTIAEALGRISDGIVALGPLLHVRQAGTFSRSKYAFASALRIALAFGAAAACSAEEPDSATPDPHEGGSAGGGSGGAAAGGASGTAGSPTGGASGRGTGGAGGAGTSAGGTAGSLDGSAGAGGTGKGGGGTGGSAGTGTGSGGTSGAGAGGGGAAGTGGADAGRADTGRPPDAGGADGSGGSAGTADGGGRDAAGTDRGAQDAGGADGGGAKFAGNITTQGQVRSDFINFWDQITPENEGKWGSVEANRNQMNWAGMDRIRDYARQHGIRYKQHNFVWGSQQPSWISGLSDSEQRAEVEEWIRLFCERYPDVAMIDVVNEPPPHTTPPYANALGGAGSSGYDWIVQAFRWARQYCPNAILILNDYNTIELQGDNNHIIDIANRIKAAGAPIDALGAQAHGTANLTASTVEGFINRMASMTGLPVYITEYDLNIADDNQQRDVMQSQFTMFWNNTNVKGITLWGYVTGATWQPNTGLISSSGQKRPAMVWLMDFLGR